MDHLLIHPQSKVIETLLDHSLGIIDLLQFGIKSVGTIGLLVVLDTPRYCFAIALRDVYFQGVGCSRIELHPILHESDQLLEIQQGFPCPYTKRT
jgi:hypothetical protein